MCRYALLLLAVAGAFLGVALAQDTKPGSGIPGSPAARPAVAPADQAVMSEKEWVAGGAKGKGAVEVEIVVNQVGSGSAPGRLPFLQLSAQDRKIGKRQLYIHIAPAVVEQLRRAGIEEPTEFYSAKVVRVRGTIQPVRHADTRSADYDAYYVMVDSINQFVSVRSPKASVWIQVFKRKKP